MITRFAIECVVFAYAMTKHGIGVPIIGSARRHWSRLALRSAVLMQWRQRFRRDESACGDSPEGQS